MPEIQTEHSPEDALTPYALDADSRGADDTRLRLAGRRVFFDGVFKGDYSLAIVNRNLARALLKNGVDLTLHCPEDGFASDPFVSDMPDVKARLAADYPERGAFDIHLRNTWPPRTDDMIGRFNAYVCYAWEEMEYPADLVKAFNVHLDLVMVTSEFVRYCLLHSGLTIPVEVVGNGTDHLEADFARAVTRDKKERAIFLHVSSCFPRKGADVLVNAFAKGFLSSDPVELLIKTFPNPHNTIGAIVDNVRRKFPQTPPIRIINSTLAHSQMADLYAGASALVAPGRGEGFGLPCAEAMLAGVPVITTAYGGQTDFCTPATAWLVDYRLLRSRSHVASEVSVWAEPDDEALIARMRDVLEKPEEADRRTRNAQGRLRAHFKWSDVARRVAVAVERVANPASNVAVNGAELSIDLISTWNQSCGIATYSQHLFGAARLRPALRQVFARAIAQDAIPTRMIGGDAPKIMKRLWGDGRNGAIRLGEDLKRGGDVLWLQHHPGFFAYEDLLILGQAVKAAPYRVKAVTLHNTIDGGPDKAWLDAFDIAFVHTPADAEILSGVGYNRVAVIPHGILPTPDSPLPTGESFTVGTFGFLYPHKAIGDLVCAIGRARAIVPNLRLKLLNCVQRSEESLLERARIEALIDACGLRDEVETNFEFLSDDAIVEGLQSCDLLCFPYAASRESSSGAVRIAMAADRPILCSKSAILRDIAPYVHVLSDARPVKIAEAIVVLSGHADLLAMHDDDRRRYVTRHGFGRAAQRYHAHFQYLRDRA